MSEIYSSSSSEVIVDDDELVCKPLKSLNEVRNFIKDPPPWRSLCVELNPHSDYVIRNMDIVKQNHPQDDYEIALERPESFCHSDPDYRDVARHERRTLPKTLVCHDFANGYHDDSKVDGSLNADAYTFYNWAAVDIFCYFSHHFITIPPLGWINVGHEHGVKVIGTVITEWTEGAQIWEELLSEPQKWQSFVSSLVTIAKTLKFDGWLLNIENKIGEPARLVEFVRQLHAVLHAELPHAVLIWYDSVTVDGHLHWQNALNSHNQEFFDACDGIFTNYSWSEGDVASSKAAAGDRATDVFVGVDVWGRNFFGGGQFNTQQAVKVAYSHGLSLAIFAPAWTHEAAYDEDSQISSVGLEDLTRAQRFALRERALWGSLWPYLNTKLPRALPFQTSFCRGLGKKRRLYGEVLGRCGWYNLRHQRYQPCAAHGPHGYVLAAAHALREAASRGVLRDARGIMRVRDSFHARQPPEDLQLVPVLSAPLLIEPDSPETSKATEVSLKRSLKDRIKDLFRKKPKQDIIEPEPSASLPKVRSSMQRISLNLKLGPKTDKKHVALVYVAEEAECLEVYLRDSFNGGSCLAIHSSDILNPHHRFIRLFHCDFNVAQSLVACVVTKTLSPESNQFLNVVLRVADAAGAESRLTLVGRDLPAAGGAGGSASHAVAPLGPREPEFGALQRYLLLHEPGFYVSVENSYGWKVRYYELLMPGCQVTSVNCHAENTAEPILLGHFGLCQKSEYAD